MLSWWKIILLFGKIYNAIKLMDAVSVLIIHNLKKKQCSGCRIIFVWSSCASLVLCDFLQNFATETHEPQWTSDRPLHTRSFYLLRKLHDRIPVLHFDLKHSRLTMVFTVHCSLFRFCVHIRLKITINATIMRTIPRWIRLCCCSLSFDLHWILQHAK